MVGDDLLLFRWIRILSDEELEKKDCREAETSVAILWLASFASDSSGVLYAGGAISDGPCADVDYSQCYISSCPQKDLPRRRIVREFGDDECIDMYLGVQNGVLDNALCFFVMRHFIFEGIELGVE